MFDSIFEANFDVDRYYGNAARTTSLQNIVSSISESTDERSALNAQQLKQPPNSSNEELSAPSLRNSTFPTESSEQRSDTGNGGTRTGKKYPRFSKAARSVLRVWFNSHIENPYPSSDEKIELEQKTGLQRSQISLWLANARRKERSKHQIPDATLMVCPEASLLAQGSTSFQTSTPTTLQDYLSMPPPRIPATTSDLVEIEDLFEHMNPFERWRADTSLDHEPVTASALASAISQAPSQLIQSSASAGLGGYPENRLEQDTTISTCDSDAFWAQSTASFSTGLTSTSSECLSNSIPSWPTFIENLASGPSAEGMHRRRCKSQRKPTQKLKPTKFHCTFCTGKSFATKHDWQRHEKSQHMCLESWACCSLGGTIIMSDGLTCAFCGIINPEAAHLESHQFSICQQKPLSERTFYRKDHFQQHIYLVHESRYHARMDIWKAESHLIRSVCGFCGLQMSTWKERCDHLTAHFKSGATMDQWQGELGLQVSEAGFVTTTDQSSG